MDLHPLIADASQHIVSREVSGLRARANKASDNRQLYNAWAGEWFAKHAAFVDRELRPVFAAAGVEYPGNVGSEYCEVSCGELHSSQHVPSALADWETTKPQRLAAILKERLNVR